MAEDVVSNIGDGLKSLYRSARNVASGASDTEIKVRDATNNDKWGPTGQQMKEIAQLTHSPEQFNIVMNTIWKRLNDNGKYWRHVYKALLLLDYIIKNGSEQVVRASLANTHQIRTLRQFQYVTDLGKDEGQNVRQRAKLLVELLGNKDRLRDERKKARENAKKFNQSISSDGWGNTGRDSFSGNSSHRAPGGFDDEDWGPSPDRGRDRDRDRDRDRRSYSRSPSPDFGDSRRDRDRRSPDRRSPDRRERRDRDRDRRDRRRDSRSPSPVGRRGSSPGGGGGGRPRAPSGGGDVAPSRQQQQQQQQQSQPSATSLLFDLDTPSTQVGSPQASSSFGNFPGQHQQPAPVQGSPSFQPSFDFNPRGGQAPVQQQPVPQQQQMFQQQPPPAFNSQGSSSGMLQPQPASSSFGAQPQFQQQQSQEFASFSSFQGVGQPEARPGDIVTTNNHLYNLDSLAEVRTQQQQRQPPAKTLAELQQQNNHAKQPVLSSAPRTNLSAGTTVMPQQQQGYNMQAMNMQMQGLHMQPQHQQMPMGGYGGQPGGMGMQQPGMQQPGMQQPGMQGGMSPQPQGYGGASYGGQPQYQQQQKFF